MTSKLTVTLLNDEDQIVKSHIMTEQEAWEYGHVRLMYELHYAQLNDHGYRLEIRQ